MNINICLCGTEAGYPHDPFCPYPLFRGTERMMAHWDKLFANRKAGLTQLSPLSEDPVAPQPPVMPSSIMEEIARTLEDFFDVR